MEIWGDKYVPCRSNYGGLKKGFGGIIRWAIDGQFGASATSKSESRSARSYTTRLASMSLFVCAEEGAPGGSSCFASFVNRPDRRLKECLKSHSMNGGLAPSFLGSQFRLDQVGVDNSDTIIKNFSNSEFDLIIGDLFTLVWQSTKGF